LVVPRLRFEDSQHPTPRYRHIADPANRDFQNAENRFRLRSCRGRHDRPEYDEGYLPWPQLLHCVRKIKPQLPITCPAELRYMDAGEARLKSAKAGPQGTPGYQ
jgi:hypothetical protein